jgi:hypothetical protein
MEQMSTVVMKQEHQERWERPPTYRAKCRSGFMTLPPTLLQEQPTVVLSLVTA